MEVSEVAEQTIGFFWPIITMLFGSYVTYHFAVKKIKKELQYRDANEHAKSAIKEVYDPLIVMLEQDVYDNQKNFIGLSIEKLKDVDLLIKNNRSLFEDEVIVNFRSYKDDIEKAQSLSGYAKEKMIEESTQHFHRIVRKHRNLILDQLKLNSQSGFKIK